MSSTDPSLDAISDAMTYASQGRSAQARTVLAEALRKDPSMAAKYGAQIAALEQRLSANASAHEKQTQRLLLAGFFGFAMLVASEFGGWNWLYAAGLAVWVGAGFAVVVRQIRKDK